MKINFSNVEDIVFWDKEIQKLFPDKFSIFEQWKIVISVPNLKELRKTCLLDFLNGLTEEDVKILEIYFNEKVYVEKLNYSIVENVKIPINSDICNDICKINKFNYFSMWRDDQHLYISFWR